jgi:hypothetical protein
MNVSPTWLPIASIMRDASARGTKPYPSGRLSLAWSMSGTTCGPWIIAAFTAAKIAALGSSAGGGACSCADAAPTAKNTTHASVVETIELRRRATMQKSSRCCFLSCCPMVSGAATLAETPPGGNQWRAKS